jgi:hypothetical protein
MGADPKVSAVIDAMPVLAERLLGDADSTAGSLMKSIGVMSRLFGARAKLIECVFDLQLAAIYPLAKEFLGSNIPASVSIEALSFQGTGKETSTATESDVLDLGTQERRGIQKYQLAKTLIKGVKDTEGWCFGKEYAAICSGHPNDIAYVLPVYPMSLIVRAYARWTFQSVILHIEPTADDKARLDAFVASAQKDIAESAQKLGHS